MSSTHEPRSPLQLGDSVCRSCRPASVSLRAYLTSRRTRVATATRARLPCVAHRLPTCTRSHCRPAPPRLPRRRRRRRCRMDTSRRRTRIRRHTAPAALCGSCPGSRPEASPGACCRSPARQSLGRSSRTTRSPSSAPLCTQNSRRCRSSLRRRPAPSLRTREIRT